MGRSRGPGGGPKRRIRTTMRKLIKDPSSTTLVVMRNSSKKPLPANWRELLVDRIEEVCRLAPERVVDRTLAGQAIPMPRYSIATGSADLVVSDVDAKNLYGHRQRRVIDFALTLCDVHQWPQPDVKQHRLAGGDIAIATNLPLRDSFRTPQETDHVHWIDLSGYEHIQGMRVDHITQYTVRAGKAKLLGVRTRCGTGTACACRELLPKLWHRGWKMHY